MYIDCFFKKILVAYLYRAKLTTTKQVFLDIGQVKT